MGSKYGKTVAEARPDLVKQWSDRNSVSPEQVSPGSTQKVWWRDDLGHEWEAPVDNRVYNNTGCPFCTPRGGKKLLPGFNDLATVNPQLASEWHPTKNGAVTPSDTLPSVKTRFWWQCLACGREWYALVNMRHSRGTGCPSCRGRKRGLSGSVVSHRAELFDEWGASNPLPLSDFSATSAHKAEWVCEKGHSWFAVIGDRNVKGSNCKQCGSGGTSRGEVEVRQFIESLGVAVRAHHRKIDARFEFDITIPELKVAVEYNGLYWHSEEKKGALYHSQKTQAAVEAGWSLVTVWEDDWAVRPEVVKRMLERKLGVSREERVSARDLSVVELKGVESRDFLNVNHLQGSAQGSVRLGLSTPEGGVKAVMVFRSRGGGSWELSRYATNAIVRGGFSRLLKSFRESTRPTKIVTFSDWGVSNGALYADHGFVRDGELKPDYTYLVKGRRIHKFNYRLKRFKDDPSLKFEEGLTERELADLNGLSRIYDAGKVRWVLNVD